MRAAAARCSCGLRLSDLVDDEQLEDAVFHLKLEHGWTWALLGSEAGVSPQALRGRFQCPGGEHEIRPRCYRHLYPDEDV